MNTISGSQNVSAMYAKYKTTPVQNTGQASKAGATAGQKPAAGDQLQISSDGLQALKAAKEKDTKDTSNAAQKVTGVKQQVSTEATQKVSKPVETVAAAKAEPAKEAVKDVAKQRDNDMAAATAPQSTGNTVMANKA